MVGCCWIELPKGKYRVREETDTSLTDSQNPGKVGRTSSSGISRQLCYSLFFRNSINFSSQVNVIVTSARNS